MWVNIRRSKRQKCNKLITLEQPNLRSFSNYLQSQSIYTPFILSNHNFWHPNANCYKSYIIKAPQRPPIPHYPTFFHCSAWRLKLTKSFNLKLTPSMEIYYQIQNEHTGDGRWVEFAPSVWIQHPLMSTMFVKEIHLNWISWEKYNLQWFRRILMAFTLNVCPSSLPPMMRNPKGSKPFFRITMLRISFMMVLRDSYQEALEIWEMPNRYWEISTPAQATPLILTVTAESISPWKQ